MASPSASISASLNGTVKAPTTLVAIMVAPAGNWRIKGFAMNVNNWFMYIAQGMKQMPTASIAFSRRSRSSSKCEIRVPSASSSGPPPSLIGQLAGDETLSRWLAHRRGFGSWGFDERRRCNRRWRLDGGGGRSRFVRRGCTRLALLFQKFFGADFALQLFAQLPRHHARSSQPAADLACDLGQALRTQHDQCDGRGEQDLRKSNIKHAASGVRFWRRLGLRLAGRGAGIEIGVLLLPELLDLLFRFALMHCVLETLDGRTQIGADRTQPLGAEYHQRD